MTPFAPAPLHLEPEIGQLSRLVSYIEAFAAAGALCAEDASAFILAAEELFANTINHSTTPASAICFSLACSFAEASATYTDDASAFDPTRHPVPDTTLPIDQRPLGGLGIHFIRRTMPRLAYARVDGHNVIRFGRPLSQPSQ